MLVLFLPPFSCHFLSFLQVLNLIPPVCEAMVDQLTIDTAVSYVRVLRLLEPADSKLANGAGDKLALEQLETKDSDASCDTCSASGELITEKA